MCSPALVEIAVLKGSQNCTRTILHRGRAAYVAILRNPSKKFLDPDPELEHSQNSITCFLFQVLSVKKTKKKTNEGENITFTEVINDRKITAWAPNWEVNTTLGFDRIPHIQHHVTSFKKHLVTLTYDRVLGSHWRFFFWWIKLWIYRKKKSGRFL